MEQADLEGVAEALHEEVGSDPEAPLHPVRLARLLLKDPDAVQLVPRDALRFNTAKLVFYSGRWKIVVKRGTPREALGFLVGHELGHWALRREDRDDDEPSCDYLGAALAVPRQAFRKALREVGPDLPELAQRFACTESLALLRLGEITGRDLALIRPGLVRVRGQLSFVWPDESTLRSWASGRAPQGLVKTRGLDGDRRRVALVVEDLEEVG